MKKKPVSNYDKQMILENTIGILFSLAITILLILNMDSIIEVTKSFGLLH